MGRQCTGVATTGSRRTKVRRLAKHEPSKSTPLYSAEHDQKKSTQSSSSSSSSSAITITITPHEAMPGSSAHADASLLPGTDAGSRNQKGTNNTSHGRLR